MSSSKPPKQPPARNELCGQTDSIVEDDAVPHFTHLPLTQQTSKTNLVKTPTYMNQGKASDIINEVHGEEDPKRYTDFPLSDRTGDDRAIVYEDTEATEPRRPVCDPDPGPEEDKPEPYIQEEYTALQKGMAGPSVSTVSESPYLRMDSNSGPANRESVQYVNLQQFARE